MASSYSAGPVNFINLTPHPVVIRFPNEAGEEVSRTIPASGRIARVSEKTIAAREIEIEYGGKRSKVVAKEVCLERIESLPDSEPNTYYVVSMLVAKVAFDAGLERNDLLAPYSEKGIYDSGRMVAVPGLVHHNFSHMKKEESIGSSSDAHSEVYQIINHGFQPITFGFRSPEGEFQPTLEVPKTDKPAIIDSESSTNDSIDGIPVYSLTLREIKNLPPFIPGTLVLTSVPVAQSVDRADVYAGDFSTVVRMDGTATPYFLGLVHYVPQIKQDLSPKRLSVETVV